MTSILKSGNDGVTGRTWGMCRLLILLMLLILNATLIFRLVWGSQSILAYAALQRQDEGVKEQLAAVDAENVKLSDEIRSLRTSRIAKEMAVRERLNFVKGNETLYLFR